jgi:diaminopimelate epimerase
VSDTWKDRLFGLRLFNPDGSEFEKSGNGLRIFARYLWDRQLPSGPDFTISTPGGLVTAHVLDATGARIRMDMGQLSFDSRAIPVAGSPREVIEEPVTVGAIPCGCPLGGRTIRITAVTIGNPHCVVFVDDDTCQVLEDPSSSSPQSARDFGEAHFAGQALTGLSAGLSPRLAHELGPLLECLPLYPNRTNVQFVQVIDRHTLRIEIWERGAGYTLASGTSSCAAAGVAIRTGRCANPVTVYMPGGEMLVEVADDWTARLTGTVKAVCSGDISEDAVMY